MNSMVFNMILESKDHDLESKNEKIKELERALKAKDDEKEGKSVDAALQNENDQLKTRLGELLMQLECAKMNISLKGESKV